MEQATERDLYQSLVRTYRLIETAVSQQRWREAEELWVRFKEHSDGPVAANIQATIESGKGNTIRAVEVLRESIDRFPFDYNLQLNLGYVAEQMGDLEQALDAYTMAQKVATLEADQELAKQSLKRVVDRYIEINRGKPDRLLKFKERVQQCNQVLAETDDRYYPLDRNRKSLIRKVIRQNGERVKFVNLHQAFNVVDINEKDRFFFKTEVYEGELRQDVEIRTVADTLIPISFAQSIPEVTIETEREKVVYTKDDLMVNQFSLLRFDRGQKINIHAKEPIFIGKPIPLQDTRKDVRLVLQLFVDGLSHAFLKKEGFEQLMPNTHRFFSRGLVFNQAYANGEWTLPSQANMITGKYTHHHGLFHPRLNDNQFELRNPMLPEYLQAAGYLCGRICTCWRSTPTYGYHKGIDRYLYKNFLGGMDSKEVVGEAIEHLQTFRERNNYLWLTLEDLHHVPDQIEDKLISQSSLEFQFRKKNRQGNKSVHTTYNENMIEKYRQEIRRVDVFLGVLYDYLERHYKQDEVLVVLQSDHGQTFLEADEAVIHENRRNVPIYFYGRDIPAGTTEEWLETVDIMPSILKLLGQQVPAGIDGIVPKVLGGAIGREYVFTEIIFPGQPYQVAVTDDDHHYYFKSVPHTDQAGLVDLSAYSVALLNRRSGNDESQILTEKVRIRTEEVFRRMKDRFRF